jgi:hypothetical protein
VAIGGDNIDKYVEEQKRMKEASEGVGATQEALEKQMKSASFQIAKAKQALQILAVTMGGIFTPIIGKAANALTRLTLNGLMPFSKMLQAAFTNTEDWQKLVEKLPEPLQRAAHAFGSLADSVGDVIRAFQDRGLAGAIQTLTSGGELDQMAAAFGALAEEAWNALSSRVQRDPVGHALGHRRCGHHCGSRWRDRHPRLDDQCRRAATHRMDHQ